MQVTLSKVLGLSVAFGLFCASFTLMHSSADAASLVLNSGAITIDTTTATITGSASASGVIEGGVAKFNFQTIDLSGSVVVTLIGDSPLSLQATNNINIGTTLDLSGSNPVGFTGGAGKLGGGSGGDTTGGAPNTSTPGTGLGGGPAPGPSSGGGGGGAGFAGAGGATGLGVSGGLSYGNDTLAPLLAGSGGGGGGNCCSDTSGGGAGGGGLELYSEYGAITLTSTGAILASGGNTFNNRSGGGGSGGGIRLDAGTGIYLDAGALIDANGGATSGTSRSGGGGSGGIIALLAPELDVDGSLQIPGLLSDGVILSAAPGLSGGVVGQPHSQGGFDGAAGRIFFTQAELREAPVPEPSTLLLMTLGAVGCAWRRRRNK